MTMTMTMTMMMMMIKVIIMIILMKVDVDNGYLVMKVIIVKEVISCDVSPVAMFFNLFSICCKTIHHYFSKREHIWVLLWGVAVSSDIRTLANTKGPHAESQLASISTFYFNLFFFNLLFQLYISAYHFKL